MRDQERAATDLPSGEASGVDLSPNRRGKCGATTKLTPTLQEGYRKVIERYAYSWRYLARRELQRELFKETGQHVSLGGMYKKRSKHIPRIRSQIYGVVTLTI